MKNYIQEILRAFISEKHGRDVTEAVQDWLVDGNHAEEKDVELRRIWDTTEGKPDATTWSSLDKVYHSIGISNQRNPQSPFVRVWRYAAAAVVAAVLSISGTLFFVHDSLQEDRLTESFTPFGETGDVVLPDGSTVQTNSGTVLLYPENFSGKTRTVYLIGEACFKVKKNPDKPFIVKSADVSVTALGTEFNVAAYSDNTDIVATLLEGKVKVDCGKEDSYILMPGQQVAYEKASGRSVMAEADLRDVTAWQRGQNVFRGKTLEEIFSVLERRFDIDFQYNSSQLDEDKYNFSFRRDSSLPEIMDIIKDVVEGFDYTVNNNICYIKINQK